MSIAYSNNELRGWPTSIVYKKNSATFASYALTYDGGNNTVGNLTGVVGFDGSVTQFGYDALYRLTSDSRTGSAAFSHTYGIDLAGNVTTINGSGFGTYDNANKLTPTGGSATYDGDGNTSTVSGPSIPTSVFAWDELGNLTSQGTGSEGLPV